SGCPVDCVLAEPDPAPPPSRLKPVASRVQGHATLLVEPDPAPPPSGLKHDALLGSRGALVWWEPDPAPPPSGLKPMSQLSLIFCSFRLWSPTPPHLRGD